MSSVKPKSVEEYRKWLHDSHGVDITRAVENHYRTVAGLVEREFQESCFWKQLVDNWQEIGAEYRVATGYDLHMGNAAPELLEKPFSSFLERTFRKNVLENRRWPDPPDAGWILPENWYSRVNDIVRTCFVVKYLDGVQFLVGKLRDLCEENSLQAHDHFEAREEGYYAAHVYVGQEYEIPSRLNWDTERVHIEVELQITTQLQEVIRRLLHRFYEARRVSLAGAPGKWQWDYASQEFAAGYLGHILHYVEGMILEVRARQETKGD